ncbi:hypothetical protein EBZ35_08715, partial [bacterium]|nr:hypothetical protein [bacterium]
MVLGGNNTATFTGDLNVNGGMVILNSPNSLPSGTGTTTIFSSGSLALDSSGGKVTISNGNQITFSATSGYTTANLSVGMLMTGTALPMNSYVTSILDSYNFTVSQGTTTLSGTLYANTASGLDLNGQTGVLGNLVLTGSGPLAIASGYTGALWNSASGPASFSGNLSLAGSTTVGGYGDLTLLNPVVSG